MDNHIFHKSILALREYLWNNKEKVVKDLEEMREKSNQDKMKQTAVEWLVDKYIIVGGITQTMVEQAKAMEKEQIIEAWNNGYDELDRATSTPYQYYNETFKSE